MNSDDNSIQVKLSDGSIVNISKEGDIYQNLANQLSISRYLARVILLAQLYGGKK